MENALSTFSAEISVWGGQGVDFCGGWERQRRDGRVGGGGVGRQRWLGGRAPLPGGSFWGSLGSQLEAQLLACPLALPASAVGLEAVQDGDDLWQLIVEAQMSTETSERGRRGFYEARRSGLSGKIRNQLKDGPCPALWMGFRGPRDEAPVFEGLSVVPGHLCSQLHGKMRVLVLRQDLLSVPPGVETLAQIFSKLSHGKEHHSRSVRCEGSRSAWLGRDKRLQVAAQARPMQSSDLMLLFFHRLDTFDKNLPYAFWQRVFLFSLFLFLIFF